jgi:hypothetical protein
MADQRQVSCCFCDKKLASAEELRAHLKSHQNDKQQVTIRYGPRKPADGSVAAASVKQQNSRLKNGASKKIVNGGGGRSGAAVAAAAAAKFHCDECGQEFPALNNALSHKFRKHPYSTKRYNCSFCGKNFPLPVSLDLHLKAAHEGNYDRIYLQQVSSIFRNRRF